MKKVLFLTMVFILACSALISNVSASNGEGNNDVLYSLDFSKTGSLEEAGIVIGTASKDTLKAEIKDGALHLSADNSKGFIIFDNWDVCEKYDSYCVEYKFSFGKTPLDEKGYLCYMFRGNGSEPVDTEDFNFRFNGTNNKFEPENPASVKAAVASGKTITVTIPIIDRYIDTATVSVENEKNEMTRTNLIQLEKGGKPGFIIRNVEAWVYSVTIRNMPKEEPSETTPASETTPTVETTPAPETTPAAETTPTVETTPVPETTPASETEKGGCGSSVSYVSLIAAVAVIGTATTVLRKKSRKQ